MFQLEEDAWQSVKVGKDLDNEKDDHTEIERERKDMQDALARQVCHVCTCACALRKLKQSICLPFFYVHIRVRACGCARVRIDTLAKQLCDNYLANSYSCKITIM